MGVEGLFEDGLLLAPSTSDLIKDTLLIMLGVWVLLGLAAVALGRLVLSGVRDHLHGGSIGTLRLNLCFCLCLEPFESICKKSCLRAISLKTLTFVGVDAVS